MDHVLLDTNVAIYLLNSDTKIATFLERFENAIFYISIITWIEMLVGSFKHEKNIEAFIPYLTRFIQLPLNPTIGKITAQLLQDHARKNIFNDTVIAATALTHNMPLITNNPKDFRGFKGLKILSPK